MPHLIAITVAARPLLYHVTLKKDWDIAEAVPAPPKQPKMLPGVPSLEEVVPFLACVRGRNHSVILTACYAAGPRISEAIGLRPGDIDSARMVLRVEQGKSAKDRCVMLSPHLLETLRDHCRHTRSTGEWLFPGQIPGRHITHGTVHDACKAAVRRSGIPKNIAPHSLRHNSKFRIIPS